MFIFFLKDFFNVARLVFNFTQKVFCRYNFIVSISSKKCLAKSWFWIFVYKIEFQKWMHEWNLCYCEQRKLVNLKRLRDFERLSLTCDFLARVRRRIRDMLLNQKPLGLREGEIKIIWFGVNWELKWEKCFTGKIIRSLRFCWILDFVYKIQYRIENSQKFNT